MRQEFKFNVSFTQNTIIIWTQKMKLQNKSHFVENKRETVQHVLKMQ